MSSSETKKSNLIAGIILLAITIAASMVDLIVFERFSITYYIPIIPIIVFGVLLMLTKIRSYGFGIAFVVLLGSFISGIIERDVDIFTIVALIIVMLVTLGLLIYKNIKK